MYRTAKIFFFLTVLTALLFSSCKKPESFITSASAKLGFNMDTVLFDTVFTTVGSTTKKLLVYNKQPGNLKISSIRLGLGDNSNFRINVDGIPSTSFNNVEIESGDSLFVFVEVTVDPNNLNTPLVITDSIIFVTNGNVQDVDLAAWGQDAYFHNTELIKNATWKSDKPHVIYNFVAVGFPGLDSNSTLNIDPGTQIYVHGNSDLYVYKSTLNVNGDINNKVIFQGDRLEAFYEDTPGQWNGIWFQQSNQSVINNAIIMNSVYGIRVDSLFQFGDPPSVTVTQTETRQTSFAGIWSNAGASVKLENCLFGNSGGYSGYFAFGGEFEVNHCTFGNNWIHSNRQTPAVLVTNYFENLGIVYLRPIFSSSFNNCIFYGNNKNELGFDIDTSLGVPIEITFNNCIYKSEDPLPSSFGTYNNMLENQDPLFVAPIDHDFSLSGGSPAIDAGNPTFGLPDDINGNARDASPDLGCYEGAN